MNENDLVKLIKSLRTQVRQEIQAGLKLITLEVKNTILEREQKFNDRLALHDTRAARQEEQLRSTNSKLKKLWELLEAMKKNDERQNEELAANRKSDQKLDQTRKIWLGVISTCCTVGGFLAGLVLR